MSFKMDLKLIFFITLCLVASTAGARRGGSAGGVRPNRAYKPPSNNFRYASDIARPRRREFNMPRLPPPPPPMPTYDVPRYSPVPSPPTPPPFAQPRSWNSSHGAPLPPPPPPPPEFGGRPPALASAPPLSELEGRSAPIAQPRSTSTLTTSSEIPAPPPLPSKRNQAGATLTPPVPPPRTTSIAKANNSRNSTSSSSSGESIITPVAVTSIRGAPKQCNATTLGSASYNRSVDINLSNSGNFAPGNRTDQSFNASVGRPLQAGKNSTGGFERTALNFGNGTHSNSTTGFNLPPIKPVRTSNNSTSGFNHTVSGFPKSPTSTWPSTVNVTGSAKVNGTSNGSAKVNGTSTGSEKVNGTSIGIEKVNGTSIGSAKVNRTSSGSPPIFQGNNTMGNVTLNPNGLLITNSSTFNNTRNATGNGIQWGVGPLAPKNNASNDLLHLDNPPPKYDDNNGDPQRKPRNDVLMDITKTIAKKVASKPKSIKGAKSAPGSGTNGQNPDEITSKTITESKASSSAASSKLSKKSIVIIFASVISCLLFAGGVGLHFSRRS